MEQCPSISQVCDRLDPVFRRYGVSRAVLFGSVARGMARETSDLDLLVDSRLHGLRFVGLVEAIRQAVEMPVDCFDVSHIEPNSRLAREIRDSGVMIYEK